MLPASVLPNPETPINTTYHFTSINTTAENVTVLNMTHYYYTITLTVWDKAGNNGTFQRNIIVNDTEAPEAKFDYKEQIDEDTEMELNASESTDNIGIVNYTWVIEGPDDILINRTGEEGNFTTNVTFQINFNDFPSLIDGWTEYGCRVMLQTQFRKFDKSEEVHQFINKHNGIITPEAINELMSMRAPQKDPQQAYLSKVAKMDSDKQQDEIASMIKQLQALQK